MRKFGQFLGARAILLAALCGAGGLPAVAAAPMPPSVPTDVAAPSPNAVRASIGETAVEDVVLRALAERRIASAGASIQLTAFSARLPISFDTRLDVERLSYQPAGDRFIAVLVASGENGAAQRFTVAGRLQQALQMPVLTRRVQAGEIIAPDDLQWVVLQDRSVSASAVQHPEDLIGRVARRTLSPGAPINAADVKRPVLVAKGAAVTLVLDAPNMQLSVRGRSLEDGAVGDAIRVANLESKMIVVGTVTPAGQVTVADVPPPMGSLPGGNSRRPSR